MKSIFHHFSRAFNEANNINFFGGEIPALKKKIVKECEIFT